MARAKKKAGDINSSSMADIAFLLLIFFLVTTTMDVDTGMKRTLPPWIDPTEQQNDVDVNERNVLKVNVSRSGAIMVGTDYINVGQDTLYYKKFDYVGTPYTHQYMTHIRAPELESAKTAKAYSQELKSGSPIVFKIPVFKNMPESAAAMPTGDGNPNNCLASLSINNYSLTPTFSKFTTSYSLIVDKSVTSVNINKSSVTIEAHETYQLSASVRPDNANKKDIKWS